MDLIRPREIKQLEIVQAMLLTDEDVEEVTYARVLRNRHDAEELDVTFMNDDGRIDAFPSVVPYGALVSHWPGECDIWEVSGVEPAPDDSGDEELEDSFDSLDGFIVRDDDVSSIENAQGDDQLEEDWDKWSPKTDGERRYKSVVDRIEARARAE